MTRTSRASPCRSSPAWARVAEAAAEAATAAGGPSAAHAATESGALARARGVTATEPRGSMPEHQITTLDSGVRVASERVPSVRSVALGFWIGTGSAAEHEDAAGISHLVQQ